MSYIELSKTDTGQLILALTPEGREYAVHLVAERASDDDLLLLDQLDYEPSSTPYPRADYEMLAELLTDYIDTGEWTLLAPDTYAMHGSFLLVEGDWRTAAEQYLFLYHPDEHSTGEIHQAEHAETALLEQPMYYFDRYAVADVMIDLIKHGRVTLSRSEPENDG